MNEFWQFCVNQLSQGLPASHVKLWILPLIPIGFNAEQTELRITAPSPMKLNWAQTNYRDKIKQSLKSYYSKDMDVVFQLVRADRVATPMASDITVLPSSGSALKTVPAPGLAQETVSSPVPKRVPEVSVVGGISVEIDYDSPAQQGLQIVVPHNNHVPAQLKEVYKTSFINPTQTFESLVVGRSNELADASARHVVSHFGETGNNPLFIYGSTGLGKTHLMHAIGNALLQENKVKKARYIHANTYYLDMVNYMRNNKWNEINQQYHAMDLLLIDDIQFFRKKTQAQEQFFHLFDAMVANNKQVVISSDTFPRELEEINERLISRFSQGLTVQIEPPALEMRVAILLRKAEEKRLVVLDDGVAFFMAKHVRSNVRELEGALQRVTAYASFKGLKVITLDVCKEALKDLLRVAHGLITVENIQKTVADYYQIRVQDMYSKTRRANISLPRQIAMYLSKELTRKSLPNIGDSFGGRDHTTVLHAVRKIEKARATDRQLNHELHILEQTLKG